MVKPEKSCATETEHFYLSLTNYRFGAQPDH
jgi:hypothetical protein